MAVYQCIWDRAHGWSCSHLVRVVVDVVLRQVGDSRQGDLLKTHFDLKDHPYKVALRGEHDLRKLEPSGRFLEDLLRVEDLLMLISGGRLWRMRSALALASTSLEAQQAS